jgi:hypothetical protein
MSNEQLLGIARPQEARCQALKFNCEEMDQKTLRDSAIERETGELVLVLTTAKRIDEMLLW